MFFTVSSLIGLQRVKRAILVRFHVADSVKTSMEKLTDEDRESIRCW